MKKLILIIELLLCCFAFASHAFAQEEASEQIAEDQNPYITQSGFLVQFGVGYGTIASIGIAPSFAYQFNEYFSLSADALLKVGLEPYVAFEITAVPRFHLNGRIGSFYMGLGLGYQYYYFDNRFSSSELKDIEIDHAFVIKPCLGFYVYAYKSFYCGLGLNLPIYIGKAYYDEDIEYQYNTPDGEKNSIVGNRKSEGSAYGVRFDIHLIFGIKFGS